MCVFAIHRSFLVKCLKSFVWFLIGFFGLFFSFESSLSILELLLFLKDIVTGHRLQGQQVFSFSILKMMFYLSSGLSCFWSQVIQHYSPACNVFFSWLLNFGFTSVFQQFDCSVLDVALLCLCCLGFTKSFALVIVGPTSNLVFLGH